MNLNHSAMLGACLAVPLVLSTGTARAAQPADGHYVYVPAGATVLVLPGPGFAVMPAGAAMTPADFPVARMIARQEAIMDHMLADMDSLIATPLPDPRQIIEAAMNGIPQAAAGSDVIMTSLTSGLTSGNGSCSETITFGYPAIGGKPQMKVTRSGNACGAVTTSGPATVVQTPAAAPRNIPAAGPGTHGPQLWTIGYPPHPVVAEARRS